MCIGTITQLETSKCTALPALICKVNAISSITFPHCDLLGGGGGVKSKLKTKNIHIHCVVILSQTYHVCYILKEHLILLYCGISNSCISSSPSVVNCSDPAIPGSGFIEPYQNTTEGAEISFRCNSQFVPSTSRVTTCGGDAMWNPDPATHLCTCECLLKE